MFVLGLIGIVIAVYKSFHVPQENIEKNAAVNEERDKGKATVLAQKELESKTLVLQEQVKSRNEETDRRFLEMGIRLDTAMTTAQNHIHTIDTKVDALTDTVSNMSNKITELATIIAERIPRK